MHWLGTIDTALFHVINQSMSNPLFDWLMPILSGNRLFAPVLLMLITWLLVKGGARGRLCAIFLGLGLLVGEVGLSKHIKEAVARPRPYLTLPEARVLGGRGHSNSMPSSHALNCFAAATVAAMFYRRSRRILFPLAAGVAFSRVYNGVHYPSDVLVGAALGTLVALGVMYGLNLLWGTAGRRWFPLWQAQLPSLLHPDRPLPPESGPIQDIVVQRGSVATDRTPSPPSDGGEGRGEEAPLLVPLPTPPSQGEEVTDWNTQKGAIPPETTRLATLADQQWLRLGYVLIAVLFLFRLAYIGGGSIELSEDEAYQWVWSKHPALSYYSKPPLIAYTQWLGTRLWGDTALGVRFFAPVIAALLSLFTLRFFAREADGQLAFLMFLVVTSTPLLAVGATLMTIDPLSVLFWTAAMLAGWRAVQTGSTSTWLWTGLWTGLGFLSKYTALIQLVSWGLFFACWPPARAALRRPGPWLALAVVALSTLPVLIWNAQHDWITVTHLAERGGLATAWRFRPRWFLDFTLSEFGLLNPVWFAGMLVAAVAAWRRRRDRPLLLFLFCMGAPLFLGYWLYTLRARVLPNWIAPAVLPLFFLLGFHWYERWRLGAAKVSRWFAGGVAFGLVAVTLMHETRLISKVTGQPLPAKQDPLRRVRGWTETAQVVAAAKAQLEAEGKPVFIIGAHYGVTGQLSFYLPEAKTALQAGGPALVYSESSEAPHNQFFFWPGYGTRQGQNAIYVVERDQASPPPGRLTAEFASVTDLGIHEVRWKDRVLRRLQLYACRQLL